MKVVYVDHTAELGGGELALARLLGAMSVQAAPVEPVVLVFEHGPLVDLLAAQGVSVEVLQLGDVARRVRRDSVLSVGSLRAVCTSAIFAVRVARWMRRQRPALVHTNSMKAHLIGGIAARSARIPVVWHVRDRFAGDYMPSWVARMMRGAGRVVPTAVIANSTSTAVTIGGRRRVHVVPSPIEPVQSSVRPPPPPPFHIAIVGRLAPWKGQHVVIDAFADAFPDGGAHLTIVGAGLFGEEAYEASLYAQVDRLGIADRVTFTGFRDDVPSELARMHVVVHASTVPEPFGQVVLEAMAASVPVIATDAGGPREVIVDDKNGLLVAPGDRGALAAALVRVADDPELRERLATKGCETAAGFAPDRIVPMVLDVYRRVMEA